MFLKQRLREGAGLQQRTTENPKSCSDRVRTSAEGETQASNIPGGSQCHGEKKKEAMKGVGTRLPFVQTSEKGGKI